MNLWMLSLLGAATLFGQARNPPLLGVLEDVPGAYVGAENVYGVRVVFAKKGAQWQPFPNPCTDEECLARVTSQYPSEIGWSIGFDGRILGHVRGRTPRSFAFYAHVGVQEVSQDSNVPTVGERSQEFGGFTMATVHRPLVANSQPYFADPEAWKPTPPSSQALRALRGAFRQRFPAVCRAGKELERSLVEFPYRDEAVQVVKAYSSNRHWLIARLRLAEAIDCTDVGRGWEMNDSWFAMNPQNAVRYLGEGMWLVDAGDYDNDGKSELLFSIDRYDEGGYELFYNDFHGHAVFGFIYH